MDAIYLQHINQLALLRNLIYIFGLIFVIEQFAKKRPINSTFICIVISIIFILFVSTITVDSHNWWDDHTVYAIGFLSGEVISSASAASEPLFYAMTSFIRLLTDNYVIYFFIIAAIYTGAYLWASKRMTNNNGTLIMFMMFVTSLFFVAYGVNTIRAGLAMSLLILGFTFYNQSKITFAILALCAINIHLSMLLTLSAFIAALFIKKPKMCFTIWLVSIILSISLGSWVEGIFASTFEDDRTQIYLMQDPTKALYNVGFRWDFVIYSLIPIVMGYYYIYRHHFQDKFYTILYCTYLIANSFWVLVIRANFTDRFAYLSWALMPIILMYPLLTGNIFRHQNNKIALMLLFNVAITFVLSL